MAQLSNKKLSRNKIKIDTQIDIYMHKNRKETRVDTKKKGVGGKRESDRPEINNNKDDVK